MRKTLAVVALTAALTGVPAAAALADDAVSGSQVVAQSTEENADSDDSDKTGLLGLLGLLGLAGLAKRKGNHDVDVHPRR
jgi:MYXO-CTERM domain-containing protein